MKNTSLTGLLLLFLSLFTLVQAQTNKTNFPEEKLGWKLGAQAYTFRLFTFQEAIEKIDSCDLKYVEIFNGQIIGAGSQEKVSASMSAEGRALVKQLAKDKGITIHAYGVVGAQKDPAKWEETFAFAQDMGIQVINVEPGAEHLQIVSDLCEKYKIKAALHNHPKPSYYWDPAVVLASLEGKSKYMGVAADVGHWMRSGLDPVACLKALEGRIFHLHFKDLNVFGERSAHDVHWGTGKLPIKEVLAELKRQKFKGMFAAEYEYNWKNSKDDVKASVINFRKLIQ